MSCRTSVVVSGESADTMYSYLVFSAVIPQVEICTSTWANQGQNRGSLRERVLTTPAAALGGSAGVVIVRATNVGTVVMTMAKEIMS